MKPTVTSCHGLRTPLHPALSKNPSPSQTSDFPRCLFLCYVLIPTRVPGVGCLKEAPQCPQDKSQLCEFADTPVTKPCSQGGGGGLHAGSLSQRWPDIECVKSWLLWEPRSRVCGRPSPPCVLTSPLLCVCISAFPRFSMDTSHTGLGPTRMTLFYLNYLFKDPLFKYGHTLRCLLMVGMVPGPWQSFKKCLLIQGSIFLDANCFVSIYFFI